MDEIQALTQRAADLGRTVDFWNMVMLWGLSLAAFAAVLIVVSTRLVVVRTGQQADVQGALSAAKERRLTSELKDKDRQIAEVKSESDQKTSVLQKDASDAKIAQQIVEMNLEKQREITARAEERLFVLTNKQAPRLISKRALSSLLVGRATGTVKILYQPDDPEAFQFGISILSELSVAGWRNGGIERIPDDTSMISTWPREVRGQMSQEQLEHERQILPISIRGGGGPGLALVATSIQTDQPKDGPFELLRGALLSVNSQLATRRDPTLPENEFIIVVGPKP